MIRTCAGPDARARPIVCAAWPARRDHVPRARSPERADAPARRGRRRPDSRPGWCTTRGSTASMYRSRRRLPVGRPAALERRALGGAGRRESRPTSSSSTAATAGYLEMELDSAESAKISLFGLLQEFHGLGLGGHALTAALTRAREVRPRAWLTTCTLDGPYALAELPRPRDAPVPHRHAARAPARRTALVPLRPVNARQDGARARGEVVACTTNVTPGARTSCPATS